MDATAFIDLAIRLAGRADEAALRTSVSRSYYGAFHLARHLLVEECGVVLPHSAEAHKKIVFCLRQSGDASALAASNMLDSMRTERNDADYDLTNARFQVSGSAGPQIQAARKTVDALARCNVDDMKSHVRSAAKTVGLLLRDNV
jgi:hypothetical protein